VFAWHFTPTHRSSLQFAIWMGSGLHARVPRASPCPWVAHTVSGRFNATARPFRLAFASAPAVTALTSPRKTTRRLILQKARRHPGSRPGSDRLEAHGFRFSFTPLAGVLFTVPSRYWFPIGRSRYLALGGGPPRFPPDSACPAVLTQTLHVAPPAVAYGALTRSGRPFQQRSADGWIPQREGSTAPSKCSVLPPPRHRRSACSPRWFGLLPVRSPLLGESSLFLRVLRCFSSPSARGHLARARPVAGRVAPFGVPWIAGCQHLPRAFRRVAASFIGRDRQGIHRAPIFANFVNANTARLAPLRDQSGAPVVADASHAPIRPAFAGQAIDAAGNRPPRARQLSMCLARRRWSRGDSNPGPPPCKGGALPAKLRPPTARSPARASRRCRWARLDSNQGPRPYQGRALTS